MFTKIDKAIVALLGSSVFMLNYFFGVDLGWDENTLERLVAIVTPFLVWLVPNKQ